MSTNLYSEIRPPERQEPIPTPARALAIGAHPDDIEFGCGGTLAKWARAGCDVTMVVLTDGSKGSWDREADPADLATLRRSEQDAAGAELGVSTVVMLDHVDGELAYSMDLRSQVARQIRVHHPDVVLSHDPWVPYELHPDHRATGLAAVDGVVAARDHLFFQDHGLEPHRPEWLLLWRPAVTDYWEDISGSMGAKLAALLHHQSQATTTMGGTDDDARAEFERRVYEWAAELGEPVGLAAAESFKKLKP